MKLSLYLVCWQQHSKSRPETGAVEQQGRAKVSTQTVLTDPRDVIRLRLLLQPAFYHVPPKEALRTHMRIRRCLYNSNTSYMQIK